MNLTALVSIIGVILTLVTAIVVHFLTRRHEISLRELEYKLDKYSQFLSGFAEMGGKYKTYEAHLKIADSVNTLNLIASNEVLRNVYELFEYVSSHQDESYSVEEQDRIINAIILSIRKDLNQKYRGNFKKFHFRTISPGLKTGEVIDTKKLKRNNTHKN